MGGVSVPTWADTTSPGKRVVFAHVRPDTKTPILGPELKCDVLTYRFWKLIKSIFFLQKFDTQ